MPALDIEALLESTANTTIPKNEESHINDRGHHLKDGQGDSKHPRDDTQRTRDGESLKTGQDGSKNAQDDNGDVVMEIFVDSPKSERGADGAPRGRRSRTPPERSRYNPRRRRNGGFKNGGPKNGGHNGDRRGSGDYYRGPGRVRSRSGSPRANRYYRPGARGRRDNSDSPGRDRSPRRGYRKRTPSPKEKAKSPTPQPTEDERDRRTVFVQQLAARLRPKELVAFFEKVGPVKEAQIVKDRISGRSKGVGYVEFKEEESVAKAIEMTGQQLLGIPIIAQHTEAEKNRLARNPDTGSSNPNQAPFHRLYVGNIHFSITEDDLQNVFDPFGELEFVQLQKEETGRSRGYGFVQFRDPQQAKEALEKMNNFDLAGRPIRVGLGNDKFTPESTATLLQRFNGQENQRNFQGSSFSGQGGRGHQAGGAGSGFDRSAGTGEHKPHHGASALDDTDVAGVNFNNYSRDALMRKLLRTEDSKDLPNIGDLRRIGPKSNTGKPPLPMHVSQASRCILIRNMFDPDEEEGDSWRKELEEDVRAECNAKYGKVVHLAIDTNSPGDIYVKFDRVTGGEKAIQGLNGRFFGGRRIAAQPVVDAVYSSLFSRTSAL